MRHAVGPLLAALAVWAHAAAAEPSRVISGEHDGFTRLVASVPEGAVWRAEKRGREVALILDGHAGGFDTEMVYPRIRRDRIAELDLLDDRITLELGCDCAVVAFPVGNSYVALDVITDTETERAGRLAEMPEAQEPAEQGTEIVQSPSVQLPTVFPSRTLPSVLPETLPRQTPTMEELAALTDIQQELARELGGAATRGVLDVLPGRGFALPQDAEAEKPEEGPAEEPAQADLEDIRNIRVSTSQDMPTTLDEGLQHLSLSGRTCPANSEFDLAAWGDDTPFHAQIGPARDALYGEFDRLDRDAALKLARLYLHFGFGVEARETLHLDPELAKDHALLISVAEIMDEDRARNPAPLRALMDCETNVSLWAILAERNLDLSGPVDSRGALLALNELPVHLRSFIAPALSQRLRSHGDTQAATAALRSLERLPDALPAAAKLERAEVALHEGQTEEATKELAEVVETNDEKSPDALVALVDAQIAAGQQHPSAVTGV